MNKIVVVFALLIVAYVLLTVLLKPFALVYTIAKWGVIIGAVGYTGLLVKNKISSNKGGPS